jgi:lysophospholipase L1-like esterase
MSLRGSSLRGLKVGLIRLTRWAAVVVLALAVVLLGSGLVLGAEAWLATRGPKPADPPVTPEDTLAGPPPSAGVPVATVVWLWDSTAAGVGASALAHTLPEQVAAQLGQPIRLTDLARSGARVADVLRLQLPEVARLHPTEVFISVGANDATHLTSRSQFRRDYGRLLAGLPASVVRVVMLGVPDMGSPPRLAQPLRAVAGWRGRELATDVRNLARRHHAIFVNIGGGAGPAFRRDPGRYFAADHYHPDDAGYHLWAEVVAAALTRVASVGEGSS